MGARGRRSSGLSGASPRSFSSCSRSTPRLISSSAPYSRATSSAISGSTVELMVVVAAAGNGTRAVLGAAPVVVLLAFPLDNRREDRSPRRRGPGRPFALGDPLLAHPFVFQLLGGGRRFSALEGGHHLGRDLAELDD